MQYVWVMSKIFSFQGGRQSLRFTYVTSSEGWTPSEDAYAAFNPAKENKLFVEKTLADYSLDDGDYTWNVLRHERKHLTFPGKYSMRPL